MGASKNHVHARNVVGLNELCACKGYRVATILQATNNMFSCKQEYSEKLGMKCYQNNNKVIKTS
jgi:hypothetical protein